VEDAQVEAFGNREGRVRVAGAAQILGPGPEPVQRDGAVEFLFDVAVEAVGADAAQVPG